MGMFWSVNIFVGMYILHVKEMVSSSEYICFVYVKWRNLIFCRQLMIPHCVGLKPSRPRQYSVAYVANFPYVYFCHAKG